MPPSQLRQITNAIGSLKPFPTVAAKVLELSAREDVVPRELIELIETDPGITSKVLKVSNSPFYGARQRITSLQDAGNLLGLSALVNLVMTCSANAYLKGSAEGVDPEALWKRCVTFALASRLVAKAHGKTDPQLAYTAGLLQNVGHLVLTRFYDDGRPFIELAMKNGTPRLEAEREVLGMNHADIGGQLLVRWALPEVLTDAVRHHHDPGQAKRDPVLAATIHLAETLAAARVAGDDPDALCYEVSSTALTLTGLAPDDFEAIGLDLVAELERADGLLGG